MATYRARVCPKCRYFLGFTVAKPPFSPTELSVTSFCLNCNYALPIHKVIIGKKRGGARPRKNSPRTVKLLQASGRGATAPEAEAGLRPGGPDEPRRQPAYSQSLRAIGGELEGLKLKTFNLQWAGDSYWVWGKVETSGMNISLPAVFNKRSLRTLWPTGATTVGRERRKYFFLPSEPSCVRYQYSPEEIERLKREGRRKRRQSNGMPDGHSASQLLRVVGDVVDQRGLRLLGVSWRSRSVSTVVETRRGNREIHLFRPDSLYDLWVKMYLRRSNRALSDVPH